MANIWVYPQNFLYRGVWIFLKVCSLVLAPFFLRSSLRSGGLGPRREKMGPALIACANFYPKNLVEDLEWPSKPLTRFIQNVGQCNVFSWCPSTGSVVYAVILRAIAFKLSPLGVFAAVFIDFITFLKILKWFSITPARRPGKRHKKRCRIYGVWCQFLNYVVL